MARASSPPEPARRSRPTDPTSNSSIRAAVAAARELSTPRALINARIQAGYIAAAAGLTLGPITEVSQDTQNIFSYIGFGPVTATLGPNRYCGPVSRPVVRRVGGKRTVVRRTHKQCQVPPFVTTSLSVTFEAAPTP